MERNYKNAFISLEHFKLMRAFLHSKQVRNSAENNSSIVLIKIFYELSITLEHFKLEVSLPVAYIGRIYLTCHPLLLGQCSH